MKTKDNEDNNITEDIKSREDYYNEDSFGIMRITRY